MEMVSTHGLTGEHMKGPGKITICMDRERTRGLMAENTRENITWIRNMVMVFTTGLMAGDMKVTGAMESSTAKANIFYQMASPKLAFGRMAKG